MSKFNIEQGISIETSSLSGEVLKTLKLMKIDDCVRNLTETERQAFSSVARRNDFHVKTAKQSCGTLFSVWLLAEPTVKEIGPKQKRLSNSELRGGTDFHSDFAPFGVPSGTRCYIDQEFYEEDKMIVDDMKSIYRAINEEINFNKNKE